MLRRMSKLIESVAGPRIEVSIRPSAAAGKVRRGPGATRTGDHEPRAARLRLMPEGGQLLIETGNAELPRFDSKASYVTLNIAHTGQEPDLDKLIRARVDRRRRTGARDGPRHCFRACRLHFRPADRRRLPLRSAAAVRGRSPPARSKRPARAGSIRFAGGLSANESARNFITSSRPRDITCSEAVDDQEALALGEVHEGSLDLLVSGGGRRGSDRRDAAQESPRACRYYALSTKPKSRAIISAVRSRRRL